MICAYDDIGSFLQEQDFQRRGRDKRVAIKVGRYISSDPVGLWGGLNTFGYVAQNPVMRIDPLGLVDVNLISPNDTAYTVNDVFNNPDYWTVGAHGSPFNPNRVFDLGERTPGLPLHFSVEYVGQEILRSGWDRKKPIQAVICYGTKGGDQSFVSQLAQYLANQIGAPVSILGTPDDVKVGVKNNWDRWFGSGYANPVGGWELITKYPVTSNSP